MEVEDRSDPEKRWHTARGPCPAARYRARDQSRTAEGSVIGKQQWQAIHERRAPATASRGSPASWSWIARRCDAAAAERWQPYRRQARRRRCWMRTAQWLSERAPQVHYSARILYQELRAQRGFTGSYET